MSPFEHVKWSCERCSFSVFSFSDGAGKSTQINLLKKHMDQHNIRVEKQLFNYNSEEKRRFLIENPISSGGEGLTLHISTTSSILSWKKASDSGNIFEMFAARKMQYTFFIGIYEHDYCRKVYGPFSIKAVVMKDAVLEYYLKNRR